MVGKEPTSELLEHRRSLWDYYDRRVTERQPGFDNAHAYWCGLGVEADVGDIAVEAAQLTEQLRRLSSGIFVDVGAGPGTFTHLVPGRGIAIDQSRRALNVLRGHVPGVSAVQADALRLPIPDKAVDRFFSSHLYGLLLPGERQGFLEEAHRVSSEIVILDAGCPNGVRAEDWQERRLPDGGNFKVFRRHFHPAVLAEEVGGDVLFGGRFYVLVRVT